MLGLCARGKSWVSPVNTARSGSEMQIWHGSVPSADSPISQIMTCLVIKMLSKEHINTQFFTKCKLMSIFFSYFMCDVIVDSKGVLCPLVDHELQIWAGFMELFLCDVFMNYATLLLNTNYTALPRLLCDHRIMFSCSDSWKQISIITKHGYGGLRWLQMFATWRSNMGNISRCSRCRIIMNLSGSRLPLLMYVRL